MDEDIVINFVIELQTIYYEIQSMGVVIFSVLHHEYRKSILILY